MNEGARGVGISNIWGLHLSVRFMGMGVRRCAHGCIRRLALLCFALL